MTDATQCAFAAPLRLPPWPFVAALLLGALTVFLVMNLQG